MEHLEIQTLRFGHGGGTTPRATALEEVSWTPPDVECVVNRGGGETETESVYISHPLLNDEGLIGLPLALRSTQYSDIKIRLD